MASQRISLPSKLPKTLPEPLQTRIESALLRSPNEPVQRLLSALEKSLDSTGWTHSLTAQAHRRIREDEPSEQPAKKRRTSYSVPEENTQSEQLLNDIIDASRPTVKEQPAAQEQRRREKGKAVARRELISEGHHGLRIPQHVVDGAVGLLKEELQRLCEVDDDKYVDWRTSL